MVAPKTMSASRVRAVGYCQGAHVRRNGLARMSLRDLFEAVERYVAGMGECLPDDWERAAIEGYEDAAE